MHEGVALAPAAHQLAAAFMVLGESVHVLDGQEPLQDARAPVALETAVHEASTRAQRVIVMLGHASLDDASAALVLALDGVVLVSRPGGTTEYRLHRLQKMMDPGMCLGVLLVD